MSAPAAAQHRAPSRILAFAAWTDAALVALGALTWVATDNGVAGVRIAAFPLAILLMVTRATGDVRAAQTLGTVLALSASAGCLASGSPGRWAVLLAGGLALLMAEPPRRRRR